MLGYMILNSCVKVKFAGVSRDPWKVDNGTRQRSVFFLHLFYYYINEMNTCISDVHEGCTPAGVKYNIICYIVDFASLAPSRIGLLKLLKRLEQYVCDIVLMVYTSKVITMHL